MTLIASGGEALSGSIVTSTSGTITSRTTVSPRSKMLSISSASCVVTSASPGSSWSSAFSSSRETKARVRLPGAEQPERRGDDEVGEGDEGEERDRGPGEGAVELEDEARRPLARDGLRDDLAEHEHDRRE